MLKERVRHLLKQDNKARLQNEKELINKIDAGKIPKHIAIIMDGNGRWAEQRGLPRIAGHKAGAEALRRVMQACDELNIEFLTVYAFSTENWRRPQEEVDALMLLLEEYLIKEVDELHANNIRLLAIGSLNKLPATVQKALAAAMQKTKNNTKRTLVLAVNYGGRREIVEAAQNIAQTVLEGKLNPADIDEQVFQNYLYTASLPDPDLLIRASGEMRLSNFLLWQLAYTELWVSEVNWPDFGRLQILQAIASYQQRERRFGGLKQK